MSTNSVVSLPNIIYSSAATTTGNLESMLNLLRVFEHPLTVETDLKHEAEQMQADGEFVGLRQCGEFVGPIRHTHCVRGGQWRGGLHQAQTQLRNLQANTSHSEAIELCIH